ncbi:DUF6506 family protein [Lentzea sp. NPDC051838]|uniref:DUF6506 family protein n=1 Tax=Lentzea sp. NPDC051838 TaxID=3154849 RepID=UPI0034286AA1
MSGIRSRAGGAGDRTGCATRTGGQGELRPRCRRRTDSAQCNDLPLVDEGAELIEFCGGADLTTAAAVQRQLGGRVPVSWPFESVHGASAFRAAYEASQ